MSAYMIETKNLTLTNRLKPLQEFKDSGNVLEGAKYDFISYQELNQRIYYVQHSEEGVPIADGKATFHRQRWSSRSKNERNWRLPSLP